MKLRKTDIEKTASGFHRLPCDGRHENPFHFYMYYSKDEILRMWKENHSNSEMSEKAGEK